MLQGVLILMAGDWRVGEKVYKYVREVYSEVSLVLSTCEFKKVSR